MTPEEFQRRLQEFEDKVSSLERLQTEIAEFKRTIETRSRRNDRNTKDIIDEYLRKQKSELRAQQQEFANHQGKVRKEISEMQQKLEQDRTFLETLRQQDRLATENIFREKSNGFPWLAKAFADYLALRDQQIASYLEKKKHPAFQAAEAVRTLTAEKSEIRARYKVASYLLEYYETLFPWLIEFRGEDLDDLIRQKSENREMGVESETDIDPARVWLTEAEYNTLSSVEKYQLALTRYWSKKKTPWELGRDYERYVGYLYETAGYQVYYQGIIKGFEDFGRDLISKKDDIVEIVQCKYWSQKKTIHEKHINQLFGTTVEYWIKTRHGRGHQLEFFPASIQSERIVPCFVTSTQLSDSAREFSNALGVKVRENLPLERYPSIKCNVSRATNEKIYHLPFDQQYDKTLVEQERNECYVETVLEAERLGFRRAQHWRGKSEEKDNIAEQTHPPES